ncbi:MAG: hypothetical protein ACK4EX_03360 [Thermaurantimonas sp.]|uniref:hypothetical protein n=1 Tax=Thermaurantimonas sp. TaxID=2681568 RepID=UPI003918B25C
MNKSLLLALFSSFLVIGACSGSKRYYKYGRKLESAGLIAEAVNNYMEALRRNPSNIEAQIALSNAGKIYLEQILSEFYVAHTGGDHERAVMRYQSAMRLDRDMKNLGVNSSISDHYRQMYLQSERIFVQKVVERAEDLLAEEKFEEAEAELNKLNELNIRNEELNNLKSLTRAEPRYRNAMRAYNEGKFRTAYYGFKEVESIRSGYKDAKRMMDLSLEKALFVIAIMPVETSVNLNEYDQQIVNAIINQILRSNNPFVKVVDRRRTETLMRERNLTLLNAMRTSRETGELLGANALLFCKITDWRTKEGPLQREVRPGYLGREIKIRNQEGVEVVTVEYSKVQYTVFSRENEVRCSFSYQLVSAETGEVLVSDVIETRQSDRVEYAVYQGDTRLLYPGTWQSINKPHPSDRIDNSPRAKRELDQLLRARQTVADLSTLQERLLQNISSRVANSILAFNPEK